MKNQINIAELLEDSPKGMELYSPIFGKVYLDKVRPHLGIVVATDKYKEEFLYDGRYGINGECMLFPSKEKTTWEGFASPGKFKDGDVCYIKTKKFEHIFIFKVNENYNLIQEHAGLCEDHFYTENPVCTIDDVKEHRLATEEEKQKLFGAIKENGYKWNTNTKTLEKLIKPKFKVDNKIKLKGGDEIGYVTQVTDCYFTIKCKNNTHCWAIERQDDWELVPDKFDISTLKPFESRVLVRDTVKEIWKPDFFGCLYDSNDCPYMVVGGIRWKYCIPYEGNEHLRGTTDDCDEYYKTW